MINYRTKRWGFASGTALYLLVGCTLSLPAQGTERLRQRAEQAVGRPLSDQEIIERIRQSGLSPAEIRNRLEQRGFDRAAADPWLSVLEGQTSRVPEGTNPQPLVSVLAAEETGGLEQPIGKVPAPPPGDGGGSPSGTPIFGRQLFEHATSQFRPVTTGPVPPDYRLGPGDQLQLVITGGVEQAYELTVSREGWIVIPDVGRVFVNGKTLKGLRESLFNRLSQVYSGIRGGPDATTHFDVSVGELRRNQVYVIGDVVEPAAYTVSSLSTVLTALYHAGGPSTNGTFREIIVNRGGEVVARLDLYDYLIGGNAQEDIRLEQGDIVYVPLHKKRVKLTGPVNREAIFELKPGETLRDVIRYAGGVKATAELDRVQIQRILPPSERRPGHHRAILDVPLNPESLDEDVPPEDRVHLRDGDEITVFAVLSEVRNQVTVSGGVWRPGTYGTTDSTRLWDVIRKAGGLVPDAYEPRAQIQRLVEEEQLRRLIPVSLEKDASGRPVENPRVYGMDQIAIFARSALRNERTVAIGGWVREPGSFPLAAGMTVGDLILKAGGLREGAFVDSAQVSRLVLSQARTDTLTRIIPVPLDSAYLFDGEGDDAGRRNSLPDTRAAHFTLQRGDAVYVRRAPGYATQERVVVGGQVMFPGPYAIQTRHDRISDVIERAGGLTPEAHPDGFQLWRTTDVAEQQEGGQRLRVGVDFSEIRRNPGGPADLLLEPSDSLFVPHVDPLVEVRGAVSVSTEVPYKKGAGLKYYIFQAGGYASNAYKARVRVRYADGQVDTKGGGFLFFGGSVRKPTPGSEIFVPEKPPKQDTGGLSTGQYIGFITTVVTSTIIAITR